MKKTEAENFQLYLKPTAFIDSDSPEIVSFTETHARGAKGNVEKGVKLFYAVRDGIRYDPYSIVLKPAAFKASNILKKGSGFCVAKAIVLAAASRAAGIPSRLGFADVRNHLSTERLRNLMKTDVFVFHGYTELFLDDRWVKVTPTFNLSLCERFGVKTLEFDGRRDSLLHPHDTKGNRHMEYILDRGVFADMPFERLVEAFRRHYPELSDRDGETIGGNFDEEALQERKREK